MGEFSEITRRKVIGWKEFLFKGPRFEPFPGLGIGFTELGIRGIWEIREIREVGIGNLGIGKFRHLRIWHSEIRNLGIWNWH